MIRALHILATLDRGGVESWLLQVARRIDRERFTLDVAVETDPPGAYAPEFEALGSRVHSLPPPAQLGRYIRRLSELLRRERYDVVHSHSFAFSGLVLRVAHAVGVPVRIAHSRADRSTPHASAARRLYESVMRWQILRHATLGLAVSESSGLGLFGRAWRTDPRLHLFHSAIETDPFVIPVDRGALRRELAIPPNAAVVGHIGRYHPQKNHPLLLRAFAAIRARRADATLVLVGSGPRIHETRNLAHTLGLGESVRFLGERSDVPRLLCGLFDVLVLPSLFEGLPRVAIEAQAAGLPIVIADSITRETEIVPELMTWRGLGDDPERWAESVIAALTTPRPITPVDALARVRASPFDIERNVELLEALYNEAVAVGRPR